MPSITKEFIIESLHIHPRSELEIGFNSAMILLLKKLIDAPVEQSAKSVLTDRQKMKIAFDVFNQSAMYATLTLNQIDEVIADVNSGHKLQSVKSLKDYTGFGLKESKDIIDYYTSL